MDIDTHQVIDLLDSREVDDVAAWLKTYPNLTIVSRDGSVSYKAAIQKADRDIIQISDRFHLLKGLTDAAKKYITKLLSANIGIPVSASHYEGKQTTDYWDKVIKEDSITTAHNEAVAKKTELVKRVRELADGGATCAAIARETGISRVTVKRYLSPNYNPSHGKYGVAGPGKIQPYAEEIKGLLNQGCTFKEIEETLRREGYTGASSTIRMFATRERRRIKEAKGQIEGSAEKIERKWLIHLLYKPIDDVKQISKEQLDKVIERFPVIGQIYDALRSFKVTLFSKRPDELEKWMADTSVLEIPELDSFINGMAQDIHAVKKAIELDYNNGLAEGSVNKLKTVKRIMYGRGSFHMLKAKVLRLELYHNFN